MAGSALHRDHSLTDIVCGALNGFKLGDRSLTVKRAIQGAMAAGAGPLPQAQTMELLHELQKKELQDLGNPTRIVVLLVRARRVRSRGWLPWTHQSPPLPQDCLTPEELSDGDEYQDIFEDMREMFTKFGLIRKIVIPRPGEKGVGKVIVEFDNVSQAASARQSVNGKPFGGKPVVAQFMEEADFYAGNY